MNTKRWSGVIGRDPEGEVTWPQLPVQLSAADADVIGSVDEVERRGDDLFASGFWTADEHPETAHVRAVVNTMSGHLGAVVVDADSEFTVTLT